MAFSEHSTIVQRPTWAGTKDNTAHWDDSEKKKYTHTDTHVRKTYILKCMEMAQKKIIMVICPLPYESSKLVHMQKSNSIKSITLLLS